MVIKKFDFYEVVVPAKPDMVASKTINKPLHKLPVGVKSGWSVQFDTLPKLIIRMELSNGIIGWGECYRDHDWRMIHHIAEAFINVSLTDLCLQNLPINFCREYDGFECAIYDAYAKAHGLRVVDLLGGPVRTNVRVGAWSSHREKEEIPDLAKRFSDMGFDCLKFKTDLDDDVTAWCESIRAVDPNMSVILDPNERWETTANTSKRLHALAEIGNVLGLEDPIPRWKLDDFALLRSLGLVPIILHISMPYIIHGQRITDAISALQANAIDGFNFNCGIANFQRLDHIAAAAGLTCWHGSEIDLGILEAMYMHSSAAASSCTWPGDIFGRLIREHDLLKEPLPIRPPYAELPHGLGLGVEPDMAAIQHYLTDQKTFEA